MITHVLPAAMNSYLVINLIICLSPSLYESLGAAWYLLGETFPSCRVLRGWSHIQASAPVCPGSIGRLETLEGSLFILGPVYDRVLVGTSSRDSVTILKLNWEGFNGFKGFGSQCDGIRYERKRQEVVTGRRLDNGTQRDREEELKLRQTEGKVVFLIT